MTELRLTKAENARKPIEDDLHGAREMLRLAVPQRRCREFRWYLVASVTLTRAAELKLRNAHGEIAWQEWLAREKAATTSHDEDLLIMRTAKQLRNASLHDGDHPMHGPQLYATGDRWRIGITVNGRDEERDAENCAERYWGLINKAHRDLFRLPIY
jgi:hypothetical protein